MLFPKKPYHHLVKDYKLQSDELNNPLNDSKLAKELFFSEVTKFYTLPYNMQWIYCALLYNAPEFQGFFKYVKYRPYELTSQKILDVFAGKICANADIDDLILYCPTELAYALALISSNDKNSVTPPWVVKNYPKTEGILRILCGTPCEEGCTYCSAKLNAKIRLKEFFGFDNFRTYGGEPLQQRATEAAINGSSLLAIFPTGGGKSLAFQLPALIAGDTLHGLTVVISPLQALMKDQVDNLERQGISDAVTINGLITMPERQNAMERIKNGGASILYISPEQLRSKTMESLLLSRNVVRFVIDEAHCFSAWGQDFRVDYLYIGEFISELQRKKQLIKPIPVSCFTATAKQKVISDICDYFKRKLDIDLRLFSTNTTRENLRYSVRNMKDDGEKYSYLRRLLEEYSCPAIVYVSRTRKTKELAKKLSDDDFPALPFNGKMEPSEKINNQNAFINNDVKIIVATSAFGMGVDKKDVGLVVHYDISDSLENYIQEAGRAGRDDSSKADCYILYNNNDLDKHFILLNQTKLSMSEIQQVWRAIKNLTKGRSTISCSALEIARAAGWDDTSKNEIETRVRTAVATLERGGYVKRGKNMPRVYATSILAKNANEAYDIIEASDIFTENEKTDAKRIIKRLIASRSFATLQDDEAESRVDYIADILGLDRKYVIDCVEKMKQIKLLADKLDMAAYIKKADSQNKSLQTIDNFLRLEEFILENSQEYSCDYSLKELNEMASKVGIKASSVKKIRTIIYYWTIKEYIKKPSHEDSDSGEWFYSSEHKGINFSFTAGELKNKIQKRKDVCQFIVNHLYDKSTKQTPDKPVEFSVAGLMEEYNLTPHMELYSESVNIDDISDALLYAQKTGALDLQGGFLVLYNAMEIKRLKESRIQFKKEDYSLLNEFYRLKIQQIHIIGEFANLMVNNYHAGMQFVSDYFSMDYKKFIATYFKGNRAKEIERGITPEKYEKIFGPLSEIQSEIISDSESRFIVVAAGPGSGKTMVLVHKLAALLTLEEVKHEQLLMLTFSRAAATEFKKRLIDLTGNATHYVEIKTFHSYCFDLLGRNGNAEMNDDVVKTAAQQINNGEVELNKIAKSVLVIDEAQDMSRDEFDLVRALIKTNEDMRVIAVGDDDQNIFEFRKADSAYMRSLITDYGAHKYEMTENYRSGSLIVDFANAVAKAITSRMKSNPIISVKDFSGTVQLIRHYSTNMEEPIVSHILSHEFKGSTCILTNTNEEAFRLLGALKKKNKQAELIQSTDGFSLYHLSEIRFFLEELNKGLASPKISVNQWNIAKQKLKSKYKNSRCLSICTTAIEAYESTTRDIYQADVKEFFKESDYKDFCGRDNNRIYVSTIHKAKGREFDRIYILANNMRLDSDEQRRKLYVAITRAKSQLFVHYNCNLFKQIDIPYNIAEIIDKTTYAEPAEIDIQLSHKDVVLSFFKGNKDFIARLQSGDKLAVKDNYIVADIDGGKKKIAKFSASYSEKNSQLIGKGYTPAECFVGFTVYWKGKDDAEETLIILPEIHYFTAVAKL